MSKTDYTIKTRLNDEVIGVASLRYGSQLWTLAKLRRRKGEPCVLCGTKVKRYAFRPITNKGNRGRRICQSCGAGGKPK